MRKLLVTLLIARIVIPIVDNPPERRFNGCNGHKPTIRIHQELFLVFFLNLTRCVKTSNHMRTAALGPARELEANSRRESRFFRVHPVRRELQKATTLNALVLEPRQLTFSKTSHL